MNSLSITMSVTIFLNMSRALQIVTVLAVFIQISRTQSQCEPWQPNIGGNSLEEPQKLGHSPRCARPVALLHEGQFSNGIGNPGARPLPDNGNRTLLPPWFNATAFRTGQLFASKHLLAQIIGTTHALSIFSAIPDISSVVFHTNQANSPAGANRRHLATFLQLKIWLEDVAPLGSPDLSPRLLKSMKKVREIHEKAAATFGQRLPVARPRAPNVTHVIDKEFWNAVARDLKNSNIPTRYRVFPAEMKRGVSQPVALAINHLGMATIQWAFIGPQFLEPELCGIWGATDEEWRAFFHMWAVLGYALGMADEYNIALQPDLRSTREYFKEIYNRYFIPSMFNFEFDEDGKILWECFWQGPADELLGSSAPLYFKKEQAMIWTLEHFLRVPATTLRAKLSRMGGSLSQGFENLIPALRFPSVRKAGVWALNNFFLGPDSRLVFGIDASDPQQVVEHAYT